jgi:hypothetical protein
MPIKNLVDFSKQMTIHTGSGQMEPDEIMATVKAFSDGQRTNKVLWDLRNATMEPLTSNALDLIKKMIKKSSSSDTPKKVAIVASNDLYKVFSRTLAASSLTEEAPFSLAPFRSMTEALKWLWQKK